jgi:hypothetical protein
LFSHYPLPPHSPSPSHFFLFVSSRCGNLLFSFQAQRLRNDSQLDDAIEKLRRVNNWAKAAMVGRFAVPAVKFMVPFLFTES